MLKNKFSSHIRRMYGRKVRMIAAPGVGFVLGTTGATKTELEDRAANQQAFPGERLVRVPVGEWYRHATKR